LRGVLSTRNAEVSATPIVPAQRAPFASARPNGQLFARWIQAKAEAWLRERDYQQLWEHDDVVLEVTRRIRRWFDDAFMIALCHPRRGWTCLATAISDLGDRCIFWDIVDGSHKYSARSLA
jgi:hypothetical protein